MAKVLKDFLFAADGFTIEKLKEGDDREFGSSLQGLVDEGFVEGAKPAAPTKPVVATPAKK